MAWFHAIPRFFLAIRRGVSKEYGHWTRLESFLKWGYPINRWLIIGNPVKIDDLGIPPFQETTMFAWWHWISWVSWGNKEWKSPRFSTCRAWCWTRPERHWWREELRQELHERWFPWKISGLLVFDFLTLTICIHLWCLIRIFFAVYTLLHIRIDIIIDITMIYHVYRCIYVYIYIL